MSPGHAFAIVHSGLGVNDALAFAIVHMALRVDEALAQRYSVGVSAACTALTRSERDS